MIDEIAEEGMIPDLQANQGLNHINNMVWFSSFSKDANPMSYSSNMTKNKLYSFFINSLINNYKSTTNQKDTNNSHRFGGQAIMIQTPDVKNRLKPTLVNKDGKMIMRGEVLLPYGEQFLSLSELHQNGFEMRFVRGEEILDVNKVVEEFANNEKVDAKKQEKYINEKIELLQNGTLGDLY